MGHVDYWLLGVSFLLGLVLTFALTVRRVTREVPVGSSSSPAGAAAAGAEVSDEKTDEDSEG
jgi:uncharacterized membrane protein ArfC